MRREIKNQCPSVDFLNNIYHSMDDGECFSEKLEELRYKNYRTSDNADLLNSSCYFDYGIDKKIPEGRFETTVQDVKFECFYKPSQHDYLYVVLDTMRDEETIHNGPYPRFLKHSWHGFLKGHLLSIEDPMYVKSDIPVGWFYGTKEKDYREVTADLVKKIAERIGVPNEHILFYSISSGGTAGLYIASKIPGSVAIASNPQLDITNFFPQVLSQFTEYSGIDLNTEKKNGNSERIDFASLFPKSKKTKYIIIVNCQSEIDFENQLIPFCKKLGIELQYGLQQIDNMAIWLIDVPGRHPHLCYESKTMYYVIDYLAKEFSARSNIDELKPLFILFSEFWHEKGSMFIEDALEDLDPIAREFERK